MNFRRRRCASTHSLTLFLLKVAWSLWGFAFGFASIAQASSNWRVSVAPLILRSDHLEGTSSPNQGLSYAPTLGIRYEKSRKVIFLFNAMKSVPINSAKSSDVKDYLRADGQIGYKIIGQREREPAHVWLVAGMQGFMFNHTWNNIALEQLSIIRFGIDLKAGMNKEWNLTTYFGYVVPASGKNFMGKNTAIDIDYKYFAFSGTRGESFAKNIYINLGTNFLRYDDGYSNLKHLWLLTTGIGLRF